VLFTDGGATLAGCGAVALSAGTANTKTATCSTSALAAGAHPIVASYGGDATNAPSSSATLTQTVNKTATTTALASSANPSNVGASVTFTATVTGVAPTGTLAFADGATPLAGCGAVALASGTANVKTATCSTSALAAGTHGIVAAYGGDGANAASTSGSLSQSVTAADSTPPQVTFASPANGATVSSGTVTISVNATDNVAVTKLNLLIDGTTVATATQGALTYKWNVGKVTLGTHTLSATAADARGNQATATLQVTKK